MSNDRDTHFLGFAELLASEIETLDNEIVPGTNDMSLSYGHWKERVRQLIARRAYDLAYHVIKDTSQTCEIYESHLLATTPDITEWPKWPD